MISRSPLGPRRLHLIGRAAALDQQGALASLIREVGDNYATYHEQLAAAFGRHGGAPDPAAFPDDFEGYSEACATVQDIVLTEVFIRRARAHRRFGARFEMSAPGNEPPLIEGGRLLSVEAE